MLTIGDYMLATKQVRHSLYLLPNYTRDGYVSRVRCSYILGRLL